MNRRVVTVLVLHAALVALAVVSLLPLVWMV